MKKFQFKILILICTVVSIPTTLLMGVMRSSLSLVWIALLLIISGSIRSLGMDLYNTITFADIDQEIMSHANTLSNMFQQLSSVFAVAFAVIAINVGRALLGISGQFTIVFFACCCNALIFTTERYKVTKECRRFVTPIGVFLVSGCPSTQNWYHSR
ncbi:MAG: hypothetical protein WDN07_00190 [Actinomycetota bacterium]